MKRHLFFICAATVAAFFPAPAFAGQPLGSPEKTGVVDSKEITEASGIAASRFQNLFWVHNDSGDTARVFGLSPSGEGRCILKLEGVQAVDCEDIAVGPGPVPGTGYIYLGDMGDNRRERKFVTVYRILEPVNASGDMVIPPKDITALNFTYPDRPHNAEALLYDPLTGDLLVVTKEKDGGSEIFRISSAGQGTAPVEAEKMGALRFGSDDLPGDTRVTGGDISPSGGEILIRTYDHAFLWQRDSAGLSRTFGDRPVPIPLAEEPQGEAICFSADGRAFYTLSEGIAQPIWRYKIQISSEHKNVERSAE